jgi:hypothetical protein
LSSIHHEEKIRSGQVNMDEKVSVSNDELLASNELPKAVAALQIQRPNKEKNFAVTAGAGSASAKKVCHSIG